MSSVIDVAECVLEELRSLPERENERVTTWKLQKLVYYAQAWHLVWDDEPLFRDSIHAWANGPVCPKLYDKHRRRFTVGTVGGNSDRLNDDQRESIKVVVKHYGEWTGQQLSDLTHEEPPWRDARKGLSPRERGKRVIPHDAMAEYYGSL